MRRVYDFNSLSEAELRWLMIYNAQPAASGMDRVKREIIKKYTHCDKGMLVWFATHAPYNGVLYAPDVMSASDAAILHREMKRAAVQLEKERAKPRPKARRDWVPPEYKKETVKAFRQPKKKDVLKAFKDIDVKAVKIADNVIGIVRMGTYEHCDMVMRQYPEYTFVEV